MSLPNVPKDLLNLIFVFSFFGGEIVTLFGIIQTVKNPGDDFPITLKMGICMLILSVSTVIMMKI